MSDKYVISSSPHFKANINTTKIMGFVLLALYPQLWAGIKFFGYRAWLVTVVSIVSCVLFEYLFLKLTKKMILFMLNKTEITEKELLHNEYA
mgnify:CR=1 FL=1